jgi:hypothetical protein
MILFDCLNSKLGRALIRSLIGVHRTFARRGFAAGLVARKQMLWHSLTDEHATAECEATRVSPKDDMARWHCCSRWQRKLSNKLNAKAFAIRLGARVAKLYWEGSGSEVIPFSAFPEEWVLKSANGWSARQVKPIQSWIDQFTGERETPESILQFVQDIAMNPAFEGVAFLAEEFLRSKEPQTPLLDYKLFCFGGEVRVIQVINRQGRNHVWYTRDWQWIPDQMNMCRALGTPRPAPVALDELIHWGDRLSAAYEFPFVRVDMYDTENGVYFGEFTHTPNVGPSLLLYTPLANRMLGQLWLDSGCQSQLEEWHERHEK